MVDFRFGDERCIGLGANPEVDVQVISQGGSSIQVFLPEAEVVFQ